MSHRASLNLDEALQELGEFGPYQMRHFTLILVPILYASMRTGQYVFCAADPGYRCLVPECESQPAAWTPGAWSLWALVPGSSCERRVPLTPSGACAAAAFSDATQTCDQWVYGDNNTIVYEFGLACQEVKRTMVGTIHACGDFTALFMIGVISDRFGRRWMLVATATSCAVAGVARSFATSYIAYVVYEYLDAMLGAGVYSTGYILALEMVGPRKRVLCGSIIAAMFALGQVVLALMAWAVPYWRHLTRLIYGPCFLFLFYYFLIEESIRWLITKGKKEEATKILLKVAKCNNTQISQDTIKRLVNLEKLPQEDKRLSLLCKVLHSRILMSRVLICSFVWITVTFTYYGLSINSVSLAGNMYVNYILTALVEIPGCALSVYTMDRFGRRATIMASLFICGASLFVLPVIPNTRAGVQLALSLVGKVGASAASSGMHVYTTELFPTSARHRALAACSTVARLGQAVAMMTPLLMKVHFWLPYLLFAALSVTAGLLLLLTPETQQRLLPDTVEQAERLSDTPKTGRRSPMVDLEKDRIPDK